MDFKKYQEIAYNTAKEKGFWEDAEARNKPEMVALINSELYEALEGHRKGRVFTGKFIPNVIIEQFNKPGGNIANFELYVKDTIEDELADAVIRILDYTGGFKIELEVPEYEFMVVKSNFAKNILELSIAVYNAFRFTEYQDAEYEDQSWGYVLFAIEQFAKFHNIDLEQHVQWKLNYNASRPYKHGKKY